MAWLESFLAFALTMLVFSTVITIIIEGIHRFLAMRENGMKLMLDALFETVIWPRFEKHFVGKAKDEVRASFTKLLSNEGMNEEKLSVLTKALVPATLTKLTSMQFAERLAQTEIGKKIVGELKDALQAAGKDADAAIDQIVKDLVQKFERFGAEATEFFKRRSQAFAVIIGFVLAFAVNFDAVQVFKAYLGDDNLRQALIANSDAIQKQYREAAERLQKSATGDEKAKAETVDALNKEFKERQATIEKALADLRMKGVPIGWSYFPMCATALTSADRKLPRFADSRCQALFEAEVAACKKAAQSLKTEGERQKGSTDCENAGLGWFSPLSLRFNDFLYWLLAVLLAGALVGLGGPFWYDTVRSLSSVLQLLRPSAPAAAPKPEPGVAFLRGGGPTPETRQPENPVEAFKTAANARKLVEGTTPAGTPAQIPGVAAGQNPTPGDKPKD